MNFVEVTLNQKMIGRSGNDIYFNSYGNSYIYFVAKL